MAKELPYFKFEPNQWENGNIQICNREDKGLFIDLCSMYWSRLGDLPMKLAIQKLCNGNATAFDSLMRENIFKVIEGRICIDFLNEQLVGFENLSSTNSENARLGWEKRRKNATALRPQSETNAIREEESKGDNKKEYENKPPKQTSDIVLFEIEEAKNEKMIGFDISNKSEDFKKYYSVALAFLNQFIKTIKESGGTVTSLEKSKIGTCVKPIRDLYVIDKIQSANVKLVFDNLPRDEFWSKNILSTTKLRKQFNTLIVKYNSKNKSNPTNPLTYRSIGKTEEQLEYERMRLDALNNG